MQDEELPQESLYLLIRQYRHHANTAYYTADNAAASLPVKKGEATGIQEVKTESVKVKGIYDLHGRKVTKPVKGIYIIDGQKVLVR